MTNEMVTSATSNSGPELFTTAAIGHTPIEYTIWPVSAVVFLVLILMCFVSGLRNRHFPSRQRTFSRICLGLGLLSLTVNIAMAAWMLVYPFFYISMATAAIGPATRSLFFTEVTELLRSFALCSVPSILGVTGAVILDFFCLKQIPKSTEG